MTAPLIENLLCRERQFCNICVSQRKGWVRVSHTGMLVELRKGRTEAAAMKAYNARRRRAAIKHFKLEHPEVSFR